MTLEEAIKIKEQYHEKYCVHMFGFERDADLLSMEALKREQQRRRFSIPDKVNLLPGETPE